MKEGNSTTSEAKRAASETEELRILEEMKRKEFDQSLFEGLEEM